MGKAAATRSGRSAVRAVRRGGSMSAGEDQQRRAVTRYRWHDKQSQQRNDKAVAGHVATVTVTHTRHADLEPLGQEHLELGGLMAH
eukprot:5477574-Prymnesium_polylepis.1